MVVTIVTGDMGPAAQIAFLVVCAAVAVACVVGAAYLVFPRFAAALRSVKW